MQAATVHQGGEVLQIPLCAVQHLLDTEQGVLGGHVPHKVSTSQEDRPLGAPMYLSTHTRGLGTGAEDPGLLETMTRVCALASGGLLRIRVEWGK